MIIHVIGPMCSGKSFLIKRLFYDHINLAVWDIKENFYKPLGIINSENKIDNFMFDLYKEYIWFALHLFLKQHKDKNIILESSGTNRRINAQLSNYKDTKIIPVFLKEPSNEQLEINIKLRKIDQETVRNFNQYFHSKIDSIVKYYNFKWMDQEDAYSYISNLLKES